MPESPSELIEYLDHLSERNFLRVWSSLDVPFVIGNLFPNTCEWFALAHRGRKTSLPPFDVTHMHPVNEDWTVFGGVSDQRLKAIYAEYADEDTKEAADACSDCGKLSMCRFHSVLSLLAGRTQPRSIK